MWRVEKDPYLASTFGTVTILDRAPDFDHLRARMESAVHAVPRLGWRVQPNPTGLGAPIWADDPDFDIDLHVRRVALPAPGTRRQLLDLASLFVLDPLDRTRPLWQFLVVEGLEGGKAALVTKMHHTITDGVNGVRMSMQYVDLTRDATVPAGGQVESHEPAPAPSPNTVDTVLSYVEATFRLPISIVRQVRELLADPASIPTAGAAAVDGIRGALTQLSETDAARSPLWTERSMRRRVEVVRTPFQSTRAAAKRLGGSLNTAFFTACAEAAHHYHVAKGAPVDELRASMAVSTRTKDSGANAFGLVKLLVPTGEMADHRALRARRRDRRGGDQVRRRGVDGHARGRHVGVADVAADARRPAAGRERRLRHLQRADVAGPLLHRRWQGARDVRHRPARRGALQRHDALVRQASRPRHQHRHRCRGRSPAARQAPRRRLPPPPPRAGR